MYDILSGYVVLLPLKLFYVVKEPPGDINCKLAKAINVKVFSIYSCLTFVPMQTNQKERKKGGKEERKEGRKDLFSSLTAMLKRFRQKMSYKFSHL